jgi:acid phosphatase family membrane protein YuiD
MISLPYILIPIIAWASAQIIKFAIATFSGKRDYKFLYSSGGMPSAHTASIVAITTTIGILDGLDTALFGLSFTLTMIILYDALGVRRATGIQAVAIRLLLETNKQPLPSELGLAKGHTRAEVAAGGLLGMVVAYILTR